MERALAEMDRRRGVQVQFNEAHGITPAGVQKAVTDILEVTYGGDRAATRRLSRAAEEDPEYANQSSELLVKKIGQLEERMYKHARDLEFEQAAHLRDEIEKIRTEGLGMPGRKVG